MIKTTNNAKDFFENYNSSIFIYGGGNPGYWVSEYMGKCDLDFEGYIDIAANTENLYLRGKKIIHPERLNSYGGEELRIVIAIGNPEEAISTLHWFVKKDMKLVCLTPIYSDFVNHKKTYDINRLLSYFRCKLLTVKTPTIISSSCVAGQIYKSLGLPILSPTINTGIKPESFMKICKNPEAYFQEEMVFSHWTLIGGEKRPVGKIRDIEVLFGHADEAEKSICRWNKMRKWVDKNNIIYTLSDDNQIVSYPIAREFCSLQEKHLLLLQNNMYCNPDMRGTLYVTHRHFHVRDNAIENWFDLLGWINGEFEL